MPWAVPASQHCHRLRVRGLCRSRALRASRQDGKFLRGAHAVAWVRHYDAALRSHAGRLIIGPIGGPIGTLLAYQRGGSLPAPGLTLNQLQAVFADKWPASDVLRARQKLPLRLGGGGGVDDPTPKLPDPNGQLMHRTRGDTRIFNVVCRYGQRGGDFVSSSQLATPRWSDGRLPPRRNRRPLHRDRRSERVRLRRSCRECAGRRAPWNARQGPRARRGLTSAARPAEISAGRGGRAEGEGGAMGGVGGEVMLVPCCAAAARASHGPLRRLGKPMPARGCLLGTSALRTFLRSNLATQAWRSRSRFAGIEATPGLLRLARLPHRVWVVEAQLRSARRRAFQPSSRRWSSTRPQGRRGEEGGGCSGRDGFGVGVGRWRSGSTHGRS